MFFNHLVSISNAGGWRGPFGPVSTTHGVPFQKELRLQNANRSDFWGAKYVEQVGNSLTQSRKQAQNIQNKKNLELKGLRASKIYLNASSNSVKVQRLIDKMAWSSSILCHDWQGERRQIVSHDPMMFVKLTCIWDHSRHFSIKDHKNS